MTDTHGVARPGLSIGHEAVDGIRVVVLRGEIDHNNRESLMETLLPPEGAPAPWTVADFRGVTFMDSSGINVLIVAHRAAANDGGWLRLAAVRESVQRVLELVGIDALIPCHATVEEAMAA
ncbi:STAS domain-containing protein [Streptomyces sp. NPDC006333]|uniref:STAS domain-containing protein n=1 Tax=Streptomyces sp. NPDC006333 TaxID=3156753 RepID=UPI0033BF4F32